MRPSARSWRAAGARGVRRATCCAASSTPIWRRAPRHRRNGARACPASSGPAAIAASAAAALALGALPPAVSASDLERAFRQMDPNGDGMVTFAEYLQPRGDTIVLRAEGVPAAAPGKPFVLPLRAEAPLPDAEPAAPAPEAMLRAAFDAPDLDRDGKVSFAEFAEHHRATMRAGFARHDRDGDGGIDSGEYARARDSLPRGHRALVPAFETLDRDRDGLIRLAEFAASADEQAQ
ncbi:MAG: EF-hand domain-containing protein [Sphingomonas sp.]